MQTSNSVEDPTVFKRAVTDPPIVLSYHDAIKYTSTCQLGRVFAGLLKIEETCYAAQRGMGVPEVKELIC